MIDPVFNTSKPSTYQPSREVQLVTAQVKRDYAQGDQILQRPWTELNDRSVIEDMNRGKRTFNAFVDESIEDPETAWQWRGTRAKARNKAIQLHAFLTSGYIIPNFVAQNDEDEEDRDFSDVMHDTIEWMIHNSNYRTSFLSATMGMLTDPVTYMGAEYCEVFQTIKEKTDAGYKMTDVLDQVLSGFNAPVYSADQILIANAFEQNIQRQRFIIKRRYIEYTEALAKYDGHENIDFVQPGIKSIYSDEHGLFYDVKDDDHPHLVEEVIYLNRRSDLEIPFLNGVYMGDSDTEANPIKHRDNRNTPKYNVVPFGYQRINEHFFYFKSLMNSMYWDNQLIDEQYRLGMNRAFLDTNMPVAVTGQDGDFSGVVFPSSVTAFANPDVKIQPLLPAANLNNIFNAMQMTEQSMEEASVSAVSGGQLPDANQKATAIAVANRNAETMIKGVGTNMALAMVQMGELMSDIAIQHITAPQIDEINSENVRLKYRTLVLADKTVDGKQVSKVLRFDEAMLGRNYSEEEKNERALELLKETGYPKSKTSIYQINPLLFSRRKYLTRIEPERMFPQNDEYQQALNMQLYPILQANPYIKLEALTRRLVHSFYRSDTEDLMADEADIENIQTPQAPMAPVAQQMIPSAGMV